MKLKLVISLTGILMLYGFTMKPSTDTTTGKEDNRSWVLGPFVRPEGANPVISPQPTSFYCPMQKQQVKWEESDTFNPAATVEIVEGIERYMEKYHIENLSEMVGIVK